MRILAWGRSDTGQKRDYNEDNFIVHPKPALCVVADGMGGHVGGAKASRLAVEVVQGEVNTASLDASFRRVVDGESHPLSVLRDAARAASSTIYDLARAEPTLQGMGTTLTALLFVDGRGFLAHVGDSRAYLCRDGRIQQLTEDHSWVQEQHRAGWMSEDEVRTSKFRHVITRSVGYERDVNVDTTTIPVHMGDCFVLCSDGLSTAVPDDEILRILQRTYYKDAPEQLIAMANANGGDDNITVIVAYAANEDDERPYSK